MLYIFGLSKLFVLLGLFPFYQFFVASTTYLRNFSMLLMSNNSKFVKINYLLSDWSLPEGVYHWAIYPIEMNIIEERKSRAIRDTIN